MIVELLKGLFFPRASGLPWSATTESSQLNGRVVQRNSVPFFQERGWRRKNGSLRGFYRTRHGSFEGWIKNPFSKNADYYIKRPPKAVVSGPHGACFTERRREVFSIHFSPRPRDVNTGIRAVERVILEALR